MNIQEGFQEAGLPGFSDEALNLLSNIFRNIKPMMNDY